MRKIHLSVGALTVLAFLITGQFMRHHQPPMTTFSDSTRLLFRSRHIYILASGLVNLMLGLYMQRHAAGWRAVVQTIGSAFLIASPIFLILAFTVEPELGFQPELWRSSAGLYALFLGSMLHLAGGIGSAAHQ